MATVHDAAGVFAARFVRAGVPVYVAWCDTCGVPGEEPEGRAPLTLSQAPGSWAIVTGAVADAASGQEVTDFATAFPEQWVPVSAGEVTIELGAVPVFVTFSSVEPR